MERETTVLGRFASSTSSQRVPSGSCSTETVVRDSQNKNHANSAENSTSGTANHQTLRLRPNCPASSNASPARAAHQYQGTH